MSKLIVTPTPGEVNGTIPVPCSKYHLHRALILGSLADGVTVVHGRSQARHIQDTLNSLKDLGVRVEHTADGYRVHGGPYVPRNGRVRVGSSGSTLQFLLGLGSRASRPVTYDGVEALRRRPIGPLLRALGEIGVRTESANDRLPVTVHPGLPKGGRVQIQGVLSQWISGLLMVAPFAAQDTVVEVSDPFNERTYVHLTASMLARFGIEVRAEADERRWVVPAGQVFRPAEVYLEPDLSSAAFPLVYAALHPGVVRLTGVAGAGSHPEGRILDILREMGVDLEIREAAREVVVRNRGTRPRGIDVDMQDIPDLIPILSVCAALARGRSVLRNIGPGRLKESNRVRAMLQLRKMGARIEEQGDNLVIDGVERLRGADISSFNDHRVLMAFAVAASVADGETHLTFPNAYRISYPEFMDHMAALGMRFGAQAPAVAAGSVAERELVASGAR
ncbi:MAG: 3-phosphoshikimate 1-carboxyvinyltransferase [Alicyclobacillaceae bacterium]|nr:3-phosphoshikimate 1-carboxyvinyltransferase [Alicyclobacillaceae bacterium]